MNEGFLTRTGRFYIRESGGGGRGHGKKERKTREKIHNSSKPCGVLVPKKSKNNAEDAPRVRSSSNENNRIGGLIARKAGGRRVAVADATRGKKSEK